MVYGGFKGLNKRTAADKVLRYKAFNISKCPKDDGYQRGLASMACKMFDKKPLVEQLKMKFFLIKNQQKNFTNQLLENLREEKYTHFFREYLGRRSSRYAIGK